MCVCLCVCVCVYENIQQRCGEVGTFLHCGDNCKLVQMLWRIVWRFLNKLKIEPSYDLAALLLDMYQKELKVFSKDVCIPIS